MRSLLTHIISFVAGAVLAAALCIITLSGRDSTATIVLSNETGAILSNVRVHNRATGGTLVVDRIARGQTKTLRIYVRGEGSYLLSVELPVAGATEAERYVETGYTITEHIKPEEIEPEHTFY